MPILDIIVEPSPLEFGGIFIAVAIGVLLLCGIVLVTVGLIRTAQKNDPKNDDRK